MHILVQYPERIVSVQNEKGHWSKRAGRIKRQRIRAWAELRAVTFGNILGPVKVKITRIAPMPLDGHDSLPYGCKATVDGVADWLGVKDNDPRLSFEYAQERGAPKYYAIKIEVIA